MNARIKGTVAVVGSNGSGGPPVEVLEARIACLERDRNDANARANNLAALLDTERQTVERMRRFLADHASRCPLNKLAVAVREGETTRGSVVVGRSSNGTPVYAPGRREEEPK